MFSGKTVILVLALIISSLSIQAQLFETRCTRYAGDTILIQLGESGSKTQIAIRDSLVKTHLARLGPSDAIETYFDGRHMGLVIYRNRKPHELIGFWKPNGKPVKGGTLVNGTGEVRPPFNGKIVRNFKSEKVTYVNGMKNGPVFYYCDCASVLRKGTFINNQKSGLWEEFAPNGRFIRQERLVIVPPEEVIETDTINVLEDQDWLKAAHCMMKPIEDCPDPFDTIKDGNGGKGGKK